MTPVLFFLGGLPLTDLGFFSVGWRAFVRAILAAASRNALSWSASSSLESSFY
jgi:hypothetical protein